VARDEEEEEEEEEEEVEEEEEKKEKEEEKKKGGRGEGDRVGGEGNERGARSLARSRVN
jgi:hypothetical protein